MELEEQNVRYTPLVLSCYGRRSTVLTSILRVAAQQAARTRDGSMAESLVRRRELAVAVEDWRRTAMMVRQCLPRPREVGPDTAWAAVLDEAGLHVREACVATWERRTVVYLREGERAREQESKREREQESKRAREQERKRERESDRVRE